MAKVELYESRSDEICAGCDLVKRIEVVKDGAYWALRQACLSHRPMLVAETVHYLWFECTSILAF